MVSSVCQGEWTMNSDPAVGKQTCVGTAVINSRGDVVTIMTTDKDGSFYIVAMII